MVSLDTVEAKQTRKLVIEGHDREQLLVNLLSEIIYIYSVDCFLCSKASIVDLTPNQLVTELEGELLDEDRHEIEGEIKAVTYHGLKISENNGLFRCRIIFDI